MVFLWWFWLIWIALLFFIVLIPFWGYPRWGTPRPYFMRTRRRPAKEEERREAEWYRSQYQDGCAAGVDVLWIAAVALIAWLILAFIF